MKLTGRHRKKLIAGTLSVVSLLAWSLGVLDGGEMSEPAQVCAVILFVAGTLWITEAIPLFVTSLLVLALCLAWLAPVTENAASAIPPERFLAPFFSDIILLFLGGFVLSEALHKHRIDEHVARWMIVRAGGSLPRVLLGVIGTTAFLSMWLSNTATAAMMLALVLPIVHQLPTRDPSRKSLLLSVPFAANLGGLGTPVGSPPNAIAIQFMREQDIAPSFAFWMVLGVPAVVGSVFAAWALLLYMFPPAVLTVTVQEQQGPLPLSRRLVVIVGAAVVTAVGWMTGPLHGLSTGTIALIPILLYFGSGLLDVKDLRALPWDVLLMMGGGLCLGTAAAESGLAEWSARRLPVADWNTYQITIAFGILACGLSAVMSNTAVATLILPIALSLHSDSPAQLAVAVAFACTLAMPLPISTPPNAMAYASGELTVTDMLKTGLIISIAGLILLFTTGFVWWRVVGLN